MALGCLLPVLLLAVPVLAGEESPPAKLESRAFGPTPGFRTEYEVRYRAWIGQSFEGRFATVFRPSGEAGKEAAILFTGDSYEFPPVLIADLLESGKPKSTLIDTMEATYGGTVRNMIFTLIEAPSFAPGARWTESPVLPMFNGIFATEGTFQTLVTREEGRPSALRLVKRRIGSQNLVESLIPEFQAWKLNLLVDEGTSRVLRATIARWSRPRNAPDNDDAESGWYELQVVEKDRRPLTEEEARSLPAEMAALRKVMEAARKRFEGSPRIGAISRLFLAQGKPPDPFALLEAYEKAYPKGVLTPAVKPLRSQMEQREDARRQASQRRPKAADGPTGKGEERSF
jgi:hypothetical protein